MIVVKFIGFGATINSRERVYSSVQEAQRNNWAPISSAIGHELYKQTKYCGGVARSGRNSVEVIQG